MEQIVKHIDAISKPFRVEISRNAKGQPQISIRVYADAPEDALDSARTLYNQADKEYPFKVEEPK